jgi:hypothetical protein
MRRTRASAGITFDAVEERRAGDDPGDTRADAGIEIPATLARLTIELHRGVNVGRRDDAPIRAAREVRQNFGRAGRYVGAASRLADENLLAARRRADAGDLVRTFDHHRFQPGQAGDQMDFLAVATRGLPDVLAFERPLAPRVADFVLARRHADFFGHRASMIVRASFMSRAWTSLSFRPPICVE